MRGGKTDAEYLKIRNRGNTRTENEQQARKFNYSFKNKVRSKVLGSLKPLHFPGEL